MSNADAGTLFWRRHECAGPAAVISRTIDTRVAEFSRELEQNPAHPEHILTVRKSGYHLVVEPQPDQ